MFLPFSLCDFSSTFSFSFVLVQILHFLAFGIIHISEWRLICIVRSFIDYTGKQNYIFFSERGRVFFTYSGAERCPKHDVAFRFSLK